jgi:hypothetical protein
VTSRLGKGISKSFFYDVQYTPLIQGRPAYGYTAETQYRKCETNIPQERNCADTVPIPTLMFSVSDLDIPVLPEFLFIHVSVSDLYIPLIGLPILLQENRRAERGIIQIAHRHMKCRNSD